MSTVTRHSVSGTGRGFFNPSCVQPGFLLGAETRVNLEAETSEVSRRKEVILGPERLRGGQDSMCWTPGVWSCQSVTDGEPREDRRSSGCWPLFETSDMGWWHYVGFSRTRDRAPSAHGAVRPHPGPVSFRHRVLGLRCPFLPLAFLPFTVARLEGVRFRICVQTGATRCGERSFPTARFLRAERAHVATPCRALRLLLGIRG